MNDKVLFIIFDEEELTKTLCENYLKDMPFSYEIMKFEKFDETLIPNNDLKKIILVDVSKTNAMVLRSVAKLAIKRNNFFLVISYDKSADLQVNSLRTGAREFLFKPLIQKDFVNAVMKIYKEDILSKPKDSNPKIVSVLSKEKGIGKTFFAFNFAYELSNMSNGRVLLVDFNNNLNDLSFTLNLNIKYNTPHFINQITPENAKEMLPYLSKYKDSHLYIMANGNMRNQNTVVNCSKIENSFATLKKYFKYIVLDVDINSQHINDELYKISNGFYYIMSNSLASVEITKQYIDRNLQGKSVKLILNRYNPKKDDAIIEQIEQKLGKQLYAKITKNILATSAASAKCSAIKEVSPQVDIAKVFEDLAKELTGK